MSLLVWLRDKIYGKKKNEDLHWYTQANPHAQKPVDSQITDAVTTEKVTESNTAVTSVKVTESKPKRTAKKVTKKAPVSKKKR